MPNEYPYGKLGLNDAHRIASDTNSLLMALQEHAEADIHADPETAKFSSKGVDLGDALLDRALVDLIRRRLQGMASE